MNTYTIRELSKRYEVQASTLRYYEEIGLLENVGRTENGQRIYTEEHIRRLDGVRCFKNTGMSIAKILEFYRYEKDVEGNIDPILDLVTQHEADIRAQIAKMQSDLCHIQEKVHRYQEIKEARDKKY